MNTKEIKRFSRTICVILICMSIVLSTGSISEASVIKNYTGCGIATANISVYNAAGGTKIGTIFNSEGFTILNTTDSLYLYVEYSTSNGAKRGYINMQSSYNAYYASCPATVNRTTGVWYGNNANDYQTCGTVYNGETVAVLEKDGYWAYVEYNTNSGRKRGYVPYSYLNPYFSISNPSIALSNSSKLYISGYHNVYSGPSTQYVTVGSVNNEYVNFVRKESVGANGKTIYYISYYVTGNKMKSGYIIL